MTMRDQLAEAVRGMFDGWTRTGGTVSGSYKGRHVTVYCFVTARTFELGIYMHPEEGAPAPVVIRRPKVARGGMTYPESVTKLGDELARTLLLMEAELAQSLEILARRNLQERIYRETCLEILRKAAAETDLIIDETRLVGRARLGAITVTVHPRPNNGTVWLELNQEVPVSELGVLRPG